MHSFTNTATAERCCPHTGVSRRARMAIAGLVWTAVGVMLVTWGAGWLAGTNTWLAIVLAVGGTISGVGAWLGMRALASKNIERLESMPERGSVITFISGKSWLITAFMIAMGSTLRHSAIPKVWLAVPYLAMGLALFMASLTYYRYLTNSR